MNIALSALRQWPWRYGVLVWAVLALAAAAGLVLALFAIRDDGAAPAGVTVPAAADVVVSNCSVADHGYSYLSTHAVVTVRNTTVRTQSYVTTISLTDGTGALLGEANATTKPLEAGESVTLTAAGVAVDGTTPGPARCGRVIAHRFPG